MFTFVTFISAIAGIFSIIAWWFKNVYKWGQRLDRYPGPKTVPFYGNALQIGNSTSMLQNLLKMQESHGEIYKLKIGPIQTNLILGDPKFIEVLLKYDHLTIKSDMYFFFQNWTGIGLSIAEGERWRQHRKLLTPAFHSQLLERFLDIYDSATNVLIQKLNEDMDKGSIDISPYLTMCSLDIICESAMNTSVNAQNDPNSKYVKSTHELCKIIIERTFSPIKIFDFLYRFSKDYQREKKAIKILHDYSNTVIKRRKATFEKEQLNLKNDFEEKKHFTVLDVLLKSTIDGKPLPDEDIRSEVDTFIFTGHDTIATTLSFIVFCLAKYPEIQEKVLEEIRTIFGNNQNRGATFQELQSMKYLEMVIKEVLRLYPAAPLMGRKLKKDVKYGDQTLPKDLTVLLFVFGIHRNPKYFPDPEKFDPERFTPENSSRRHPCAYMPFGAGPHNCIGQRFAMLEMKSLLSKLLRQFELVLPIPEYEPVLAAEIILKSANGITVRLKKRKF